MKIFKKKNKQIILEQLYRLFFGKPDEDNWGKNVFIAASLVAFAAALVGIIWDFSIGMPIQLNILVGIFMLLYFLLYFNARFLNRYNPLAYVFISLFFLSFLYILNGGLNGSIPSLYIVSTLVFVTICKSKYQPLILILTAANLLGLFVAERYSLRNYINPYLNNETRETDLTFGYLAALILSFIIIAYFKKTITSRNRQLHNLNKSKDLLFNIIAHDLRSPFTSITGFSELMKDESEKLSKEEVRTYAELINQKSQKTLELLESLLNWGKIRMDNIRFKPEAINLNENVNDIILLLREDRKQKNIEINNSISDELKVFVDGTILNTILRNLLSNAIKFTPDGGKVRISAGKTDKNKVSVVVKDNGIGMEKQVLENLFRFDVPTNRKGTNGEESIGFGLMITKELIDKLGENISVESALNKGTTFTFTVPEL